MRRGWCVGGERHTKVLENESKEGKKSFFFFFFLPRNRNSFGSRTPNNSKFRWSLCSFIRSSLTHRGFDLGGRSKRGNGAHHLNHPKLSLATGGRGRMLDMCRANKKNLKICRFVQFKAECFPIHGNSRSKKSEKLLCVRPCGCNVLVLLCRCVWASVLLFGTFFLLSVYTQKIEEMKNIHTKCQGYRLCVLPSRLRSWVLLLLVFLCVCCFCSGFNGNFLWVEGRICWKCGRIRWKGWNSGAKRSSVGMLDCFQAQKCRKLFYWSKACLRGKFTSSLARRVKSSMEKRHSCEVNFKHSPMQKPRWPK